MFQQKYLILPIQLTNLIYKSSVLDKKNQLGYLQGPGRASFKNHHNYQGNFHNGMMHGQGTINFKSGPIYKGQINYNQLTGQGRYQWPTGSFYQGSIKNGLREGEGKYQSSKGYKYSGHWLRGRRHGTGKLQFQNGSVYEGQFQHGKKQGKGRLTFNNGDFYQGSWKQDKMHGLGSMIWQKAGEMYRGNWVQGIMTGFGQLILLQERGQNRLMRNVYKGQWKDGKRTGIGIYYYANGSKYQGQWKQNLKEGLGILTGESGEIVQGKYVQDKLLKQTEKKSQKKRIKQKTLYQQLICLDDLILHEIKRINSSLHPLQALWNQLLRNNGNLKNIFRHLTLIYQSSLLQNTFSLTLESIWKILRDMKIFGGRVTPASLNRRFFVGKRNLFDFNFDLQFIENKLKLASQFKLKYLDHILLGYALCSFSGQEGKSLPILDVHQGSRLVLYRHFIQILVRIAYIRKGDVDLNKSLQKVISQLMPLIQKYKSEKKESMSQLDGVSNASHSVRRQTPHYAKKHNLFIFNRICKSVRLSGIVDKTVTVRQLIELIDQNGLLTSQHQIQLFYFKLQKLLNVQSQQQQRKGRRKRETVQLSEAERTAKYHKLLSYQLIFNQFSDIIYVVIDRCLSIKYSQSIHQQRQTLYQQLCRSLKFTPKVLPSVSYSRAKLSPKDISKRALQERRREQAELIRRVQGEKRAQEQEERQLEWMQLQDVDIQEHQLSQLQESDQYF